MRTCEVAIIGLGLMGSSALHSLWGGGAPTFWGSIR
jgi:3-hydroxyisobutyrate dehydrogenase-like beta-hydroxyacid dehydrogenase